MQKGSNLSKQTVKKNKFYVKTGVISRYIYKLCLHTLHMAISCLGVKGFLLELCHKVSMSIIYGHVIPKTLLLA